MYRIIGDRCSGKTSQLMLLAKETGAKIACSNPVAMRHKAEAYGIVGIEFVPYSELIKPYYDPEDNNKVLIDELEAFLHYCVRGEVLGYTLSNED